MTLRARSIFWLVLVLVTASSIAVGQAEPFGHTEPWSGSSEGQGAPPPWGAETDRGWGAERSGVGWDHGRDHGWAPAGSRSQTGFEPWLGPDSGGRGGSDWRWDEGATAGQTMPAMPTAPGDPAQPVYRFRGDPPAGSERWDGASTIGGYRFRPLTDRESQRQVQTPGWRPLEGDRAPPARPYGAPGLMDALTPPERTYGFEPNPWP
jgi:hypothetical protein